MPPLFCEEVEEFLELVIDAWEGIFELDDALLRKALYRLYNREANPAAVREGDAKRQIEELVAMHRQAGNVVVRGGNFVEVLSAKHDLDLVGEDYRIYVNASGDHLPVVGRVLIDLCGRNDRIVSFKIVADPRKAAARTDCVVIYVKGKAAALALATQLDGTISRSSPSVPSMTRRVADGISVAADPQAKADASFGQLVISPFALAIRVYRDTFVRGGLLTNADDDTCTKVFRLLLGGAFRAHRLNPLVPFASRGGYVLPAGQSPAIAHAIGAAELSLAMRTAARARVVPAAPVVPVVEEQDDDWDD